MASSLLNTIRSKRNGAFEEIEATVEDQIDNLREEIATLTKLIGKNSAAQSKKFRAQAENGYEDLIARGEDVLKQLQHGYSRGTSELRTAVRRNPTAAIGTAAAVGILIALLARR